MRRVKDGETAFFVIRWLRYDADGNLVKETYEDCIYLPWLHGKWQSALGKRRWQQKQYGWTYGGYVRGFSGDYRYGHKLWDGTKGGAKE